MLKCGTENLRNSCRWHPPWTNENCDLSALARKIFSAGLPPRTPPGMNSHLSTAVHTWKTHRIWATCLGDPGPLADDHGAPRDPPCGGLPFNFKQRQSHAPQRGACDCQERIRQLVVFTPGSCPPQPAQTFMLDSTKIRYSDHLAPLRDWRQNHTSIRPEGLPPAPTCPVCTG